MCLFIPLAFGALIIKERLRLIDEETVAMIMENLYLQWFIGFQEFQIKAPFNDSHDSFPTTDGTLSVTGRCAFRNRLPAKVIKRINDIIIQARKRREFDDNDVKNNPDPDDNKGH